MDGDDSNSIAAQTSTLVLACADRAVKTLSGIAFKALGCQVNTEGDVTLKYQVCTAPSRGNPVTQPENAVWCSTDPAHPSYRPPAGKVCLRAACDTEPVNSLNGWSAAQTITWEASLPASASASQRTNNGLGLTFYPPLNGSVSPSFKAGSDNMTAVKVVESYLNTTTNQGAVALKVAFRHKATVTKEMLTDGSASVPDPSAHTAQWDTLLKLQDNPLIPQYQQKFAQNGSECIQQIQNGIAKDGKISVCDPDFVGESGVRPIQKTAQVGAQGQECSTTAQCLEEVVNTNTWRETCQADVPLATRTCSTTQDYQMVDIHSTRKRSQDICREKRTTAQYTCSTTATVGNCRIQSIVQQGGIDISSINDDSGLVLLEQVNEHTYRFTIGPRSFARWPTNYYKREFVIDILDKEHVYIFKMYRVQYDDTMAVAINGNWVWSEYNGGRYYPEYDRWGRMVRQCVAREDWSCSRYEDIFQSHWERSTVWNANTNINFIPHLVEGRNVLRIDTGVVGQGTSLIYVEISAWKPVCDPAYVINGCTTYEAAR